MGLFGSSKITMTLGKNDFAPGENIRGNIELNLKKPVKARKLVIKLYGIRKDRVRPGAVSIVSSNTHAKGVHSTKIYDFEKVIDGEKDYQVENYPFELEIPPNIFDLATLPIANIDKKYEAIAKSAHLISSHSTHIEWHLRAQLDIPAGFDVKTDQDIQLYEKE